MTKKIECINFKSFDKGGLLGFANLFVVSWGLEVYNVSVYRNSQTGHRFITFPSREGKDKEGNAKWFEQIRFRNKDHQIAFQKIALESIDEWCAANVGNDQQPEVKDGEAPF